MKLAVLVCGDGRNDYLAQTMQSLKTCVTHQISARLMVNDEAHPAYCSHLDVLYPEWTICHTERGGMARAIQAGFDLCLQRDPDYVLWIEEDMMLTRTLPIREAIDRLEHKKTLAQMCFKREVTPHDGADDQLQAILNQASFYTEDEKYTYHDFIFSMNPCLIPKRILELGWSEDNEAGMTKKLLDSGYVFGSWGHVGDEPWARHIGTQRSEAWQL